MGVVVEARDERDTAAGYGAAGDEGGQADEGDAGEEVGELFLEGGEGG